MLRQKPDAHGYGPIALLPSAIGDAAPVDATSELGLPMRTLSIAIVVPPRSALADGLDTVWPLWQQLFVDCEVPLDELPAPPDEFLAPLELLRRREAAGM